MLLNPLDLHLIQSEAKFGKGVHSDSCDPTVALTALHPLTVIPAYPSPQSPHKPF